MKISIKKGDFYTDRYELVTGKNSLKFIGKSHSFSIPYEDIGDLHIVQDVYGQFYFSMYSTDHVYEGQVLDTEKLGCFIAVLNLEIKGNVDVEIKKE